MIEVPQESLMRWTVDDVRRMIDCGGFAHPERFELVEGLILEKMGQNEPHILALMRSSRALRAAFGTMGDVQAGISLFLSEDSVPEPDVMALRPELDRAPMAGDVLLILEVSDTSLRKDQTTKAALYARHGIPEYAIVDVTNRRVEIRRRPEGEAWGETLVLSESGAFTPLGASGAIRVADLFGEV